MFYKSYNWSHVVFLTDSAEGACTYGASSIGDVMTEWGFPPQNYLQMSQTPQDADIFSYIQFVKYRGRSESRFPAGNYSMSKVVHLLCIVNESCWCLHLTLV